MMGPGHGPLIKTKNGNYSDLRERVQPQGTLPRPDCFAVYAPQINVCSKRVCQRRKLSSQHNGTSRRIGFHDAESLFVRELFHRLDIRGIRALHFFELLMRQTARRRLRSVVLTPQN